MEGWKEGLRQHYLDLNVVYDKMNREWLSVNQDYLIKMGEPDFQSVRPQLSQNNNMKMSRRTWIPVIFSLYNPHSLQTLLKITKTYQTLMSCHVVSCSQITRDICSWIIQKKWKLVQGPVPSSPWRHGSRHCPPAAQSPNKNYPGLGAEHLDGTLDDLEIHGISNRNYVTLYVTNLIWMEGLVVIT